MIRDEIVEGLTYKMRTGCGNVFITVNVDRDNKPFEVFVKMGKCGGCAYSQNEAIGRMLSLLFRNGVLVEEGIRQLKGIRCVGMIDDGALSCADAVGVVLERFLKEGGKKGNV